MQSNRDYATENLNLRKQIEALEKENQELREEVEHLKNVNTGLHSVLRELQENKYKIKKAINDKIEHLEKGVFLASNDYVKGGFQALKELKEVIE